MAIASHHFGPEHIGEHIDVLQLDRSYRRLILGPDLDAILANTLFREPHEHNYAHLPHLGTGNKLSPVFRIVAADGTGPIKLESPSWVQPSQAPITMMRFKWNLDEQTGTVAYTAAEARLILAKLLGVDVSTLGAVSAMKDPNGVPIEVH